VDDGAPGDFVSILPLSDALLPGLFVAGTNYEVTRDYRSVMFDRCPNEGGTSSLDVDGDPRVIDLPDVNNAPGRHRDYGAQEAPKTGVHANVDVTIETAADLTAFTAGSASLSRTVVSFTRDGADPAVAELTLAITDALSGGPDYTRFVDSTAVSECEITEGATTLVCTREVPTTGEAVRFPYHLLATEDTVTLSASIRILGAESNPVAPVLTETFLVAQMEFDIVPEISGPEVVPAGAQQLDYAVRLRVHGATSNTQLPASGLWYRIRSAQLGSIAPDAGCLDDFGWALCQVRRHSTWIREEGSLVQGIPHEYSWQVDAEFTRADIDFDALGDTIVPENNLQRITTVVQGVTELEVFRDGFEGD
jgi:hypothetical protein